MTALILVVDDVPANVKLLEAKLSAEYYSVVTAKDGFECIAQAKQHKPDLILLDVMMPGMDGFETCKKLKEDYEVSHIPVVMVTALSEKADRLRGLDSGADDFLTKPINDTALFARVKSLVRIKLLLDELRLRDKTGSQLGIRAPGSETFTSDVSGSRVLLIDDDTVQGKQVVAALGETYTADWVEDSEEAVEKARGGNYDVILVSTMLMDTDGMRIALALKNQEETRHVPVLILVDEDDTRAMLKGLDLGINDYLLVPVDRNEMAARVKTQIRRKKYQEALKSNYYQSVSMAITDALTGLYNRHYLNSHLENMIGLAKDNSKPLSLMIMDMDHFKMVNDTHGHDAGDMVLKQLSELIVSALRSTDLAARFGGEEFVVLMPETDLQAASEVAERVRKTIESSPFKINAAGDTIDKTVSIGVSTLKIGQEDGAALLKRADEVLYEAKHGGRNQVKLAQG